MLRLLKLWFRPFRTLGAFSLLWLATLALGIAISTVCFTYFEHTVLRPLDLPHADRLFAIELHTRPAGTNAPENPVARANDGAKLTRGLLQEINALKGFEAAGSERQNQRMSGNDLSAQHIALLTTTANWQRVLGAKAQIGRDFARADLDSDVIMISDALWRGAFKSDRKILKRRVEIGGESVQIIGVLPPGVQRVSREDVFRVASFDAAGSDDDYFLSVVARRFSGLAPEQLAGMLDSALAARRARVPLAYESGLALRATDLHTQRMSGVFAALRPVLALVALLALLMACNASSLFAVSVLERLHALAIEAALGANTWRLLAQIAAQSLFFSSIAAVLAVPLCPWLFRLARQHFLGSMRMLAELNFTPSSLLIVGSAFAVLNMLGALLPTAAILRRTSLRRDQRSSVTTAGARFARAALTFQLIAATAVILLSLQLLRSLNLLAKLDPGFDMAHLWSAQIVLPNRNDTGKPEKDQRATLANIAFMERVQLEVAHLPGVLSASFASDVPLGQQRGKSVALQLAGAGADAANMAPYALLRGVDSHFADALGVTLLAGRLPSYLPEQQVQEAAVNQRYVERFLNGRSPINQLSSDGRVRIVGVLPNFKQAGLTQASEPDLYVPLALDSGMEASLLVRSSPQVGGEERRARDLTEQVRAVLRANDANVPMSGALDGASLRAASIEDRQRLGRVLSLFAGLAILTTALGLFSLSAYSVTKRAREFGLRLAVGAAPAKLLLDVLIENLRFCGACALAGLVLGAGLSQLLTGQLYAVRWFDLRSALGAVAVIQLVCVLAAMIPAWRASRTDPMRALRSQ
jgi:putative ABC transport system permease protein